MIKISVVRDKQRFIWEFTVRGHARFAKSGSDIVCSAVSALAYTAAGALEELAGINSYIEKDGYMKCVIPSDIHEDKKVVVKIILDTIVLGFKQIEHSYRKYVSVLEEEV